MSFYCCRCGCSADHVKVTVWFGQLHFTTLAQAAGSRACKKLGAEEGNAHGLPSTLPPAFRIENPSPPERKMNSLYPDYSYPLFPAKFWSMCFTSYFLSKPFYFTLFVSRLTSILFSILLHHAKNSLAFSQTLCCRLIPISLVKTLDSFVTQVLQLLF